MCYFYIMNIFVAASYSAYVDYETGEVSPEYKEWLEDNLTTVEGFGHEIFCALRADDYRINDADPAEAFRLDIEHIEAADALIAFVDTKVSAGVQTEIGYALALGKKVVLAHPPDIELSWFNQAIVKAEQATEVTLPLDSDPFITE